MATKNNQKRSPGEESFHCATGRLITKNKAPCCSDCGIPLWKAIWNESCDTHFIHFTHNCNGERLGYTKTFRRNADGKPICWNAMACMKRRKKQGQ